MNMKFKKAMMVAVVALGVSSVAHAAVKDQGHGKVTFTGSIIDAPCSITPNSIDQTIELGQISKVALKDSGKSTPRNFSIDLENCELGEKDNNKVTVTFTGMESSAANGLLGITGTAKGASVAITDGSGAIIKLGEKTKPQQLQNGGNTLSFAAYLQGDTGTAEAPISVTEGEFQTVANFTLAYQ